MSVRRYDWRQCLVLAILIVLVVLTLLPFYVTIVMSQKTNGEILNRFWAWPSEFRPEFFASAYDFIMGYIFNSIIVSMLVVAGVVVLGSLNGYVFARLDFAGKHTMFSAMIALMMIPALLTLVPAFLWYKGFPLVGGNDWMGEGGRGFLNTRAVLVIAFVAGGQIFGTFLCRTFFESLPKSLFEAARIDGASELQIWWRIALPLSTPILVTLGMIAFVGCYNDYVWPLITISDESIQVFAVGVTKLGAEAALEYGPMMAGYLIGSIPLIIIFSLGMKYYIEGLTHGAVKG